MNKLLIIALLAIFAACQPASKKHELSMKDSTQLKPVQSGYADVNGLKMYYEVYGSGKPLVMIHGSYMNIPLNWAHMIPSLAKDRQVIVAEMQGHGRTKDIERELSYEGMADDVSGLLKHLKVDSADILGYSMGGGIAFQVAVRHPQQVRRLVILSGTYAHDGWWPEVEAVFATFTGDMFKGTPIQQQYDSMGNDPARFDAYIKKVIRVDTKPYDWSNEVKNIKAPILMAIGDADGVRYEHALELFRAKGGGKMGDMGGRPKSRLAILPGTTHVGMMQQTDVVVPMVANFLDADLDAPPPTF
ncbi:alpha/beta hydrolase [Chitinophaga horti]|uniref:Alpha/beta hydrolase n=1 Tax=Chitinophaga horti TaxID=2920382 RepID=A0ABY6J5J1_9BACT|nr:alpha/beta hydrolase [Chitinophaga horti]UYQ94953.1 alpha/beta hydrolase [Chitinophaga horti]